MPGYEPDLGLAGKF